MGCDILTMMHYCEAQTDDQVGRLTENLCPFSKFQLPHSIWEEKDRQDPYLDVSLKFVQRPTPLYSVLVLL